MKTLIYLLVGALVLMALGALLRIAIGIAFWAGLAIVIGGIVVFIFRGWNMDRRLEGRSSARQERRIDRDADKALKDLEKRI
jgi:hypothetical protein